MLGKKGTYMCLAGKETSFYLDTAWPLDYRMLYKLDLVDHAFCTRDINIELILISYDLEFPMATFSIRGGVYYIFSYKNYQYTDLHFALEFSYPFLHFHFICIQ